MKSKAKIAFQGYWPRLQSGRKVYPFSATTFLCDPGKLCKHFSKRTDMENSQKMTLLLISKMQPLSQQSSNLLTEKSHQDLPKKIHSVFVGYHGRKNFMWDCPTMAALPNLAREQQIYYCFWGSSNLLWWRSCTPEISTEISAEKSVKVFFIRDSRWTWKESTEHVLLN